MTLETLQNEMIAAMKSGDKFRKTVISGLIAQIKKSAIDKGCRDNISEDFVNAEILKAEKQAKESIVGAEAAHREDLLKEYVHQYDIIHSYAPQMIDDEDEIRNLILDTVNGEIEFTKTNRGKIMKLISSALKGKADMSIVSKVVGEMLQ